MTIFTVVLVCSNAQSGLFTEQQIVFLPLFCYMLNKSTVINRFFFKLKLFKTSNMEMLKQRFQKFIAALCLTCFLCLMRLVKFLFLLLARIMILPLKHKQCNIYHSKLIHILSVLSQI